MCNPPSMMQKDLNYLFLIFFIIFNLNQLAAQEFSRLNYDFIIDQKVLSNPLVGGLNSPQLSMVDLNEDGIMDLYVFDRQDNKQLTFLNNGTEYTYAPEYAANFPELGEWVQLRDYNKDGAMDIFAYSDAQVHGILVYRGVYENKVLKFERFNTGENLNILHYTDIINRKFNLVVTNADYPAIEDVDCDGDLDVLTFDLFGSLLVLYTNQSVERGFGMDSLLYFEEDDCWGGFEEDSFTSEIRLSSRQGDCVEVFAQEEIPLGFRHAGSTTLALDLDGDQDKEIIIGDIGSEKMVLLHNEGDCEVAWMQAPDIAFPNYDVPVELPIFPAAFYLDLDNDGKKDLAVSPNNAANSENLESLWFYKNTTSNSNPVFELQKKTFLIDEMIDLGEDASPTIVDYNADGLLDLVVGNGTFFVPFGVGNDARLFLFKNVGTPIEPRFELVDDDYLDMQQFTTNTNITNFTPTFGDLDNDGDLDALVGEVNGQLFYAENIAGAGNPLQFAPWIAQYMEINIGQQSTPQIIDLNRDGLMDLIIGENKGNVNYFQNIGSPTEPQFNKDETQFPNARFLGNVDSRVPGFGDGFSAPFFIEQNGRYHLLVGGVAGNVEWYDNVEGNFYDNFSLRNEFIGGIDIGGLAKPALADLDSDGRLEIVVGTARGGLTIFQTDFENTPVVSTNDHLADFKLQIYPNPAKEETFVNWEDRDVQSLDLRLLNITGQIIRAWKKVTANSRLDLNHVPSGVYFLEFKSVRGFTTRKLVID